ncbi:MAG: 50S ribosomal protein L21e [Halobacteria archaeon]|nr:50S ribosomal protein L21e [Halobacteria archaeon]
MPNSKGPQKKTRNKLRNDPRDRGQSPPSRAVQEFDEGQNVHVAIDPSVPEGRPNPRFHGETGVVVGEQGTAFEVEIHDGDKKKTLFVKPQHLKPQSD